MILFETPMSQYIVRFYSFTWKSGDSGIRAPSLYHWIVGLGFTGETWVLNWAGCPSNTIWSFNGVNFGKTSVVSGAETEVYC